MDQPVAFSINIGSQDCAELTLQLDKALEGRAIPVANRTGLWQFEGPPEGSFGFGDGFIVFFGDAWRELCKVPGAVLAVAEGIKEYLKNRPNTELEIIMPDGRKIKIKGNMSGKDIVEIVK